MKEEILANRLLYYININKNEFSDLIFLCIGTNKLAGDSLGLYVGEKLKEKNINVYGDLINPINYLNIEENIRLINKQYIKPYIIVIDAALSNKCEVGEIVITNGNIQLGKALYKNKYYVGNIAIRGIVENNKSLVMKNFKNLRSTSMNMVNSIANRIVEVITITLKYV